MKTQKILKFIVFVITILLSVLSADAKKKVIKTELFPNGEEIPTWFNDTLRIEISTLGKQYLITEYGVKYDSQLLQTAAIQKVIDLAAENGGGVIVVPHGTFLTGALFFRQGTHLKLEKGAVLKGSDRIENFPIVKTRMEGQTLDYFSALINADGLKGFTITGPGTIDGNGYQYWNEFWIRRKYNRQCTNLEAMRPRLVYLSNCEDVTVQDVNLVNSPFWTNHLYRCHHVKYLGCYIYAPTKGLGYEGKNGAPSSDAIDIDVCHDILVSGCYMNVNDDAVVIKGGKGTWADQDPHNGPTYNIIVQDCEYGKVHGCLTLGSESLHDWNIILRRIKMTNATRVLWLKMRPDTPQHYEYVRVEDISGKCGSFLFVKPWTQFYVKENRPDMPMSQCNNIEIKNVNVTCKIFKDVVESDKYILKDFSFENLNVNETGGESAAVEGLPEDNLAKEVLSVAVKVNDYFMQHCPDPTAPTFVKRERPSNLWTRAVYYEGLMALNEVAPRQDYLNYAVTWADFHQWTPRYGVTTRHADDQCCSQTYIDLYRLGGIPSATLAPTIENIDSMLVTDKVDDWWWIDAIQMAMPVFSKLYAVTGEKKYLDRAWLMYSYTRNELGEKGMLNPEDNLWWRDKDFDAPYAEPNGEDCYWSRGNGWVLAALARVMDCIPNGQDHYNDYMTDFCAMAKAIKSCQREDGFWNVSMHDPSNFGGKETSGTALFVYGLAWGIRNGILSASEYLPVVDKAWKAIQTEAIHEDGYIGYVQGTGKQPSDGQPVEYDSHPDFEDYGTGCVLLAAAEYYKLKKN